MKQLVISPWRWEYRRVTRPSTGAAPIMTPKKDGEHRCISLGSWEGFVGVQAQSIAILMFGCGQWRSTSILVPFQMKNNLLNRRMEWILDFLLLALPLTVGVPWLLVLWVLPPILLVTVPLWSPCVSTQTCFGWNGVRHFQTNQLVYDHFDNFFSEKLEQVESIYPLVF